MKPFSDWCDEEEEKVGRHSLRLLAVTEENQEVARDRAVRLVPKHYTSSVHHARVLEKLGKPGVAKLLESKLPVSNKIRSGDLGEIFATEYIEENTDFLVPIKRLRWKDHREMSMRGEDAVGVFIPLDGSRIRFLKMEAKSEANLSTRTVRTARKALKRDNGRPSSHSLTFISERLLELGNEDLADSIDTALLRDGISARQVTQMVFAFCGNDPKNFLKTDLENYRGVINQVSVGLRIEGHQEFIANVYDGI